ncbi:carcinine hydrolase/isopenicillin-N N-acyltransferase family protein [Porphyromonas levii]|uniref:Peptidase C45 hydrolase domain-containing protein n=1 Tax=Porphyromonas levii TaxID=28114 RepID=A0A4Y8WRD2_9PORP|nr:carcinine hydrolase/isopenicillin-N N-acyltransferase family protein [Porphyromonas levii]TFH96988.1 hypothetical protein E4P47_01350 [Porphyromonas levii]TFH97150.1 hypothetical protein E4P48_02605 [Porphyromonas levii]
MKKAKLLFFALLLLMGANAIACTTAVISGRATNNGRPMIWKLRDTEEYDNHMRRFESPLGYYVGLVNDSDTLGLSVWGGHNSHGFAIMNSASFNVNVGYKGELENQEGVIMKKALAECRTLSDFEQMLNTLPRPMGLAAHFGVIDAEGGAAFYEVNNESWTKFDANEAAEGYVLRTNYSLTGTPDKGYGYVRFRTASHLFSQVQPGDFSVQLIGSDFSRSMYNSQLETDFRAQAEQEEVRYIDSDDLICRFGTSSMILVEGVQKGEDPLLTTSWVQVGNPFLSPLVPIWTDTEVPMALQTPNDNATIATNAKALKLQLYPLRTVEQERYLYMPLVVRNDGKGLVQQFQKLEAEYISRIQETQSKALQSELIEKGLNLQQSYLQTSK